MICVLAVGSLLPASAVAMPMCAGPNRVTCVVDGDTVWIEGEKIRLADIDTPEAGGGCIEERLLAARAAERLRLLLTGTALGIERQGKDCFGRTLAIISVGGRGVGETLIAEGLARPWRGSREQWCP